ARRPRRARRGRLRAGRGRGRWRTGRRPRWPCRSRGPRGWGHRFLSSRTGREDRSTVPRGVWCGSLTGRL
ncbi:MAG: hypothetical protein AVDCRST_MAG55-1019, partial [uncultured Rubrobacteraceae bacterium]